MGYARVKDIVKAGNKGGIEGLKKYFAQPDLIIEPDTWANNIKQLIEEQHTISVMAEIELINEKFNFYNNVSEKERGGTDSSSIDK